MSENLDSDTFWAELISWPKDTSHTSYNISKGIVGSSLKRPRTLLEGPIFKYLFDVILARLA